MSLSSRMPNMLGEVALRRKSFPPRRFLQDFAAMPRNTTEPRTEVGKNLSRLIGDDSVNAWANRHQLSQTTINRIVTDKMDPTVSTVERIAAAVGVEPWRLLAPNMGYTTLGFDALTAYESNLVTTFRQLSPEDQRTLLINVNARVRLADGVIRSGVSGETREDVPSGRENKNIPDAVEPWKDTPPQSAIKTSPPTPSSGRGLGRTIESEGQEAPPARKRRFHK
jgi:transcriptional regulator with XRE-family HTH domain